MEMDVKKTQLDFKPEGEESSRKCPACSACAREQARFCATCGRALEGSYFPSDALRSSYHQQETYEKKLRGTIQHKCDEKKEKQEESAIGNIFTVENNNVAKMALVCATYALIPYLGILLCPCALLFGGVGLIHSYRFAKYDGRKAAIASIVLGVLILCVQLVLWWLLYTIPDLNR